MELNVPEEGQRGGQTGIRRRRARRATEESPRKKRVRKAGLVVFLIYIAALCYFLFFADWYDHAPGSHWEYHYNLKPFLEIRRFLIAGEALGSRAVLLNLAGNVVGFLPFGFFLPVISRRFRSFPRVVLLGCLMSGAVELIQLVTKTGVCDIDDVILNTAGTALGYLLFLAVNEARKAIGKRRG